MSNKVAFVFPGQGAQYVGMGKDFYDQYPIARAVFEEADEKLGRKFSDLIFFGPQEELTLTKNSQLAIYIVSYAIYKVMEQEIPDLKPAVCAGLSLGEYTALTAAGKISFSDGLLLVQQRAKLMNDACVTHPGSMSVVLGMEPEMVEETLKQMPSDLLAKVANLNCPGQVVIAGTRAGLDSAAELLKQNGAKRILPLEVSGAFHSPLMQEAQDKLLPELMQVALTDSSVDLVMNTPGDFVKEISEIRQNLIRQVTQPVRWEKGVRAMVESGVDLFVEMGCGKTLSGMNKRIGVTCPTLSVEKVSEIQELAKDKQYANAQG